MTKLAYDVVLDSEELAHQIAYDWGTDDIRAFIETICEQAQDLGLDEAILADRYRKVKEFYGGGTDAAYDEKLKMNKLCKRYPAVK